MVVAEVVDDNEEDLLAAVEGGEDDIGHDAVGHQGLVAGVFCHPLQVVFLDELCKVGVGLFLLHGEHLGHIAAGAGYLQLPTYKALIHFLPVVEGAAVLYLHRYILKRLLIVLRNNLVDDVALVDVFLERQKYLHGVDGFYEVVGDGLADGLVHDVLLFALGNHHDGSLRLYLLDTLQGFKTRYAGHHFVKQYEVECMLLTLLYGVYAIAGNGYVIAFFLKKYYVGVKVFYLIINPKKLCCQWN